MPKIGIDIVQVERISLTTKMINAILHPAEFEYFKKLQDPEAQQQFLAGRWAAKEAIVKVIEQKLAPKSICIQYDNLKPVITTSGLTHIEISISHEKDYAVAVALNL